MAGLHGDHAASHVHHHLARLEGLDPSPKLGEFRKRRACPASRCRASSRACVDAARRRWKDSRSSARVRRRAARSLFEFLQAAAVGGLAGAELVREHVDVGKHDVAGFGRAGLVTVPPTGDRRPARSRGCVSRPGAAPRRCAARRIFPVTADSACRATAAVPR